MTRKPRLRRRQGSSLTCGRAMCRVFTFRSSPGIKPEDKDAALVVIVRTSFDLSEVTAEYVDGPAAAGALRITGADNERLTLVDAKRRSGF